MGNKKAGERAGAGGSTFVLPPESCPFFIPFHSKRGQQVLPPFLFVSNGAQHMLLPLLFVSNTGAASAAPVSSHFEQGQ